MAARATHQIRFSAPRGPLEFKFTFPIHAEYWQEFCAPDAPEAAAVPSAASLLLGGPKIP